MCKIILRVLPFTASCQTEKLPHFSSFLSGLLIMTIMIEIALTSVLYTEPQNIYIYKIISFMFFYKWKSNLYSSQKSKTNSLNKKIINRNLQVRMRKNCIEFKLRNSFYFQEREREAARWETKSIFNYAQLLKSYFFKIRETGFSFETTLLPLLWL